MELKTYFAQDRTGNLIPSASVSIFLTGTTTLASGLTNVSGTALTNPFTADADGKIQFRAPDGIYDMQVSLGSTTGVKVTFQCVDVEQQLSDANSAADRAELAADQAEEAAAQIGQPSFSAASQSAMLALDAKVGALAIRTDTNETYRLITLPASTLANWQLIKYDASDVVHGSSTIGDEVDALKSYPATGAEVSITPQDRANRALYSDDFGNPGTDSGNSLNLAMDYLQSVGDVYAHGGKVSIPRGYRTVNTTVLLDRTAGGPDVSDSVTIVGEGPGTSELRAGAGLSSVSAVVKSNEPGGNAIQTYRLADFSTRGGYNGVRLETASRGSMERVKVEGATNSGFYIGNSWVNVYSGLLSNNCGLHGVEFDATRQKTSTVVNSGYALNNAADGWLWGFMNYSAATGVASDASGHHGHHIKNSEAFVMTACGNEAAKRSGIFAEASSAIGANRSILIQGHFSHSSNLDNDGWANLLHARSLNGVDNRITIRDSTSHAPNFGTPDIIADGVGTVVVNDNNITPNGVRTYNGGYIDHVHHTLLVNQLAVTASTATPVCKLKSTQGHTTNAASETSSFAGEVTVVASTNNPSTSQRRTAIYKLLVCVTQEQGKQVTVVGQLGYLSGNVAGAPSFTWSIDSSNRLVATPIASAAGNFWFEITTDSQVYAEKL